MAIEVKTEYIDQFLKKQYDEKGKVVTQRNKIWQRVAGCLPLDNLSVNKDPALKLEAIREMKESDGDHYYIAHLSGGDNGLADWVRYFTWLTMFVNEAKNEGFHVWVIMLKNDCPDDTFDIFVGIREE